MLDYSLQGIYFIYDSNSELVYIGKTGNYVKRFRTHYSVKEGRTFKFLQVSNKSDMAILELKFIDLYKPKENIQDKFQSVTTLGIKCPEITSLPKQSLSKFYSTDLKKSCGNLLDSTDVLFLLDILTKEDLRILLKVIVECTTEYNILIGPFHALTPGMSKAARSRYKRKLIEGKILAEHNNKLMLNPFVFNSRGDKNIQNCIYLTQRVWKYLFEDMNSTDEQVIIHSEHMFGKSGIESKCLSVGHGDFQKFLQKPQD